MDWPCQDFNQGSTRKQPSGSIGSDGINANNNDFLSNDYNTASLTVTTEVKVKPSCQLTGQLSSSAQQLSSSVDNVASTYSYCQSCFLLFYS